MITPQVIMTPTQAQDTRMAAPAPRKRPRKVIQEHYDTVHTMLISMVPYIEIQKQLSMRWGRPRKYVLDVIGLVHQDWADQSAALQGTRRHQIRAGFERIMSAAWSAKGGPDLNTLARVQRELGLLDGCYQATQVEITGAVVGIGVGINLGGLGFKTPQEVAERIDELKSKLATLGPRSLTAPTPTNGIASALLTGTQTTHPTPSPNVIDIRDGTEQADN